MEYIDATSNEAYPNRLLPDALALARNSDNNVIDFIQLDIIVNGAVDGFVAGDTTMLITPLRKVGENADEETSKKTTHWINGKWLVKSIMTKQERCNPDKTTSIITVVRPTLIYNVKKTTINKSAYLYSVD